MSRQTGRWVCMATGIDYELQEVVVGVGSETLAEFWLDLETRRWHWLILRYQSDGTCLGGAEGSKRAAQMAVRRAQRVMQ